MRFAQVVPTNVPTAAQGESGSSGGPTRSAARAGSDLIESPVSVSAGLSSFYGAALSLVAALVGSLRSSRCCQGRGLTRHGESAWARFGLSNGWAVCRRHHRMLERVATGPKSG